MTGTGVEGVTVVRSGTTVVRDLTLQARDGELMVVLGASGSGKSTLLRAIAGLDPVAAGRVLIKGRDVTALPPGDRNVAMVFEASALIPFLDVSHNLGWGLRQRHVPEAEVGQRIGGRARQLRLGGLLSRRPGELSQGERGLVGIGKALVALPEVFLLDEPLAGLDAAERWRLRREIVEVIRTLGVSTFYVTHDQAEGMAVADRIALLRSGDVVQVGRPMELYERPVDLFTAGFIGSPPIGLLPARLVSAAGLAGFEVGDRTLPLWGPVPSPLRGHVGRDVVLGLRAEDVHPAAAGRDPDSVELDALVVEAEYTGLHSVVTVVLGSSGASLRAFFPPRDALRPGDAVQVTVTAASAHVFDAVTGRALWHPGDGAAA